MEQRSARILVTNDDGIASPGLQTLARRLSALGEVTIVAPEAEQSAVGHSITTRLPLRMTPVTLGGLGDSYSVGGTPADCVKLALGTVMRDRWPELVVSGVNLGPNTATNVIYSGTVSAATEARILGVPSFAISLGTYREPRWAVAADIGVEVARQVLHHGLPPRVLLNVNVPNLPATEVRGVRFTRQGESVYLEDFVERKDPRGLPYYWLAGSFEMRDTDEETDAWALEHGYVSITPITFDLTSEGTRAELASSGWGD